MIGFFPKSNKGTVLIENPYLWRIISDLFCYHYISVLKLFCLQFLFAS